MSSKPKPKPTRKPRPATCPPPITPTNARLTLAEATALKLAALAVLDGVTHADLDASTLRQLELASIKLSAAIVVLAGRTLTTAAGVTVRVGRARKRQPR